MKGTVIMPDIKTALQNALSKAASAPTPQIPAAWDDEGADAAIETITTKAKEATMPKQYFKTTNNVTRTTFNYVKNNPGNTRTQITAALEMQGFKPNSTTSLVAQMIRQGHMRETNGAVFAAQDEYTPIKGARIKKQEKPAQPVVHIKKEKPTRAYDRHSETPSIQINATWDAETLLNNLSIKQARALYDELRKIFGG